MAGKKADEKTKTDEPQVPEMEKITFQGTEIEVSKDVAEVIKTKEHEMSSGLKTKHEQAMAEAKAAQEAAKAEQDKIDANLAADIEWLNTHPPESWAGYNRLTHGGDGKYTGDPALLEFKDDDNAPVTPTTPAMKNDPVQDKLNAIEKRQQELENAYAEKSAGDAVASMRAMLKKDEYKFADEGSVLQAMQIYHTKNGVPANVETVKAFLEDSHKRTKAIIDKTGKFEETPRSTGVPPLGAAPRPTVKNPPTSWDDPKLKETTTKYYEEIVESTK